VYGSGAFLLECLAFILCIDYDGELQSIADVDRALEPIMKHVWRGKTLLFPILLDPTFQTSERFDLSGLTTVLLADPEGKLTKGEEAVLAQKLTERPMHTR
jgi:hypothetical protein